MNLHDYLALDDSLSVAEICALTGKSDAQVRQWQHGYAGRRPSPDNCVVLERATNGRVLVEDLRPDGKWMRIKDKAWPNPAGRPLWDGSMSKAEAA